MDDLVEELLAAPALSWTVKAREALMVGSVVAVDSPTRVRVRSADETCPPGQANLCEKPASGTSMTIPITLGVCIPLVAALGVLFYFHRRNVKKVRLEDAMDPHKSLDFGLGDGMPPTGGKSKRKSFLTREKDTRAQRQQMSMDMNLSSPYLLPPGLHNSRESLNSLARTIKDGEDPYRPVVHYAASDAASIRSMPRGGPESRSTSRQQSRQNSRDPTSPVHSSRQNSFPFNSPLAAPEPTHVKPEGPFSAEPELIPAPIAKNEMTPYPENDSFPIGVAVQEPPAVAQKIARKPAASLEQPSPADSGVDIRYELGHEKNQSNESSILPPQAIAGLGLVNQPEPRQASVRSSVSSGENAPVTMAGQQREPHRSMTAPIVEEPIDYYRFDFADDPEVVPSSDGLKPDGEERGRNMQRMSHVFDQNQNRQSGLGVPQGDNRRLSVGFRPLPPAEITESEDPEHRANRIRSFYKEYFEDGKPGNAPPMPQLPPQHQYAQHQVPQQNMPQQQYTGNYQGGGQYTGNHQGGGQYYEDYSENYAQGGQDGAYFDPVSNSFVMPYAQPVSRRAMTPPPLGQRFPGPRGPARQFHGSMGGNRMPGPPGSYGGSRPGSATSSRMGPRPGSSASAAYYNRPRAGSAMSGSQYGGAPKKKLPPPQALNTLPTPSKLKDDSFGIFNAMDFAPPETYADRQRGRSQSPMGERRPYKPTVPVHTPLVNAFEELSSIPSPHLLQNSSSFTGLDFAPPRKFADPNDNRSETGSIRSNKSGISAVQLGAIRNGAGRVSKLPGDTIFTQAAMKDKLKPQWGLRD